MKLITCPGKLSFTKNLLEGSVQKQTGKLRYGVTFLLPHVSDPHKGALTRKWIAQAEAACLQVAEEEFGRNRLPHGVVTKSLAKQSGWPFRDQAEWVGKRVGYVAGALLIEPGTHDQPGIVDVRGIPIPPADLEKEIYPGIWAQLSLNVAPLRPRADVQITPGVTFYLNNVRKLADGARLDGRVDATDEEWGDTPPADFFGEDDDEVDPLG